MAAKEMLERFSRAVMRDAFNAAAGSGGDVLVGVGDAVIWFSLSLDCL